jgi:hypothetical protein
MVQINRDKSRGELSADERMFVDFGPEPNGPVRAHEIRYPGGRGAENGAGTEINNNSAPVTVFRPFFVFVRTTLKGYPLLPSSRPRTPRQRCVGNASAGPEHGCWCAEPIAVGAPISLCGRFGYADAFASRRMEPANGQVAEVHDAL